MSIGDGALWGIEQIESLEKDLMGKGVSLERVSKNSKKVKKVRITVDSHRTGMFMDPPSKKVKNITFAEIKKIEEIPEDSKAHKRLGLKKFKYCLEITLTSDIKFILVFGTKIERDTWRQYLGRRTRQYNSMKKVDPLTVLVAHYWSKANNGKSIPFSQVFNLMQRIVGPVSKAAIEQEFFRLDKDKNLSLDFEEFTLFLHAFVIHFEFREIFNLYARMPDSGLTCEEFCRCAAQGGRQNVAYYTLIFEKLTLGNPFADYDTFSYFMCSPLLNPIVEPNHLTSVVDSMDFHLSHYYINSSHNSYLTGDQLQSNSSILMYRDILQSGCRCVEIDCWDGSNNDPIVYHGHTATSKIRFEDVIKTINEFAFKKGTRENEPLLEFPVILSLEVHTSQSQSNVMAGMMKEIFGEKLLLPEENVIYSPNNLKGRILIKWKRNETDDDDIKDIEGSGIRPDRVSRPQYSASLSSCSTVCSMKSNSWGEDADLNNVQSYSENSLFKILSEQPNKLAKQNTRMLTRTYPAGSRVLSTNYDPMAPWSVGCHMVALNFQTRDEPIIVNEAMFSNQNAGCGFVLKPSYLCDVSDVLCPTPYTMTVTIASGNHLSESNESEKITNPFVQVWIYGYEERKKTTKTASEDVIHPVWNESYRFSGSNLDLDMICFRVFAFDDKQEKHELGESYLPIKVLRPGYRAVALTHPRSKNKLEFASLICSISIEPTESDEHS